MSPAQVSPAREPDKITEMLLNDLLAERAEIRSAIDGAVRNAGVAVAIIVGSYAHFDEVGFRGWPAVLRLAHIHILLLLVSILVATFLTYVAHLKQRLKDNLEAVNVRLAAFGEGVSTQGSSEIVNLLLWVSAGAMLLLVMFATFLVSSSTEPSKRPMSSPNAAPRTAPVQPHKP